MSHDTGKRNRAQGLPRAKSTKTRNSQPDWVVADDGLNWLRERGISDATITAFGIVASGNGAEFPAANLPDLRFWKNADSEGHPKYKAPQHQLPKAAMLYHAPEFVSETMRTGHVWLTGGFVDVWTLHAAAIYNAACFYTEERMPDAVPAFLLAIGARVVHYVPDRDASGQRAAVKLASVLADSGLLYLSHELPAPIGSKYDLNAMWQDYNGDQAAFVAALRALPVMDVQPPTAPPSAIAPAPAGEVRPRGLARVLDNPEYWLQRAITEHADRNGGGFWLACQLRDAGHDQRTAETLLTRYAQIRVTEGSHPYTEREALASVRSAYSRPARYAVTLTETAPASETAAPRYLPDNARERLAQLRQTGVARLLDGLYQHWQPGRVFDAQEAGEMHPTMNKDAVYRVFRKLEQRVMIHACYRAGFRPLGALRSAPNGARARAIPSSLPSGWSFAFQTGDKERRGELFANVAVYLLFAINSEPAKSANNSRRGRKAAFYRLPSPLEVSNALRIREPKGGQTAPPSYALESNGKYMAAGMRAMIARRPGEYSRDWLGAQWGRSGGATRYWQKRYPELADIRSAENLAPVDVEGIEALPVHLGALRRMRKHEDYCPLFVQVTGTAERYTATQWAVNRLFERGYTWEALEFYRYAPNTYWVEEDAPQDAETAQHNLTPTQSPTTPENGAQGPQEGESAAPLRYCRQCGQAVMPGITPAGECPFCGTTRPPVSADPLVSMLQDLGGEVGQSEGGNDAS